ncbi:MAG: orotidine-5'-phosphate decarboxylase [Pyrinomonadaceae bacterium]|nr:orotidine-5'-phosphate decarboxylase [Pyrinomonadaceae bacterium]
MKVAARDRLIIALDVETPTEGREIFAALKDYAGMFKIGSQLFTAAGPAIVREIVEAGARVFLDLKFHDIPNTVARAGVEAARLGVSIFNVHALGGSEMMRRAVAGVHEAAARENIARPSIIAVTMLTSADESMLSEVGLSSGVEQQVERLARLSSECGMDGVVASPREVSLIRSAVERKDFLVVTPGVRPTGAAHGDQKRVMTPLEAVRAGADYLVIGRAILEAPDMPRAAEKIINEMERASE